MDSLKVIHAKIKILEEDYKSKSKYQMIKQLKFEYILRYWHDWDEERNLGRFRGRGVSQTSRNKDGLYNSIDNHQHEFINEDNLQDYYNDIKPKEK